MNMHLAKQEITKMSIMILTLTTLDKNYQTYIPIQGRICLYDPLPSDILGAEDCSNILTVSG